jgi:Spy/CpxP family protein refolding chaperone
MKRAVIIACLTSVVIAAGAYAADGSTNAPPSLPPHPMRPMLVNLLPPRVFDALALTADQQAKYNTLNESFKSDVAKLRTNSQSSSTNAVPGAGRQEARELRHGYIEKLRGVLTADQNAKLTQALENMGHGRREGGQAGGANPPGPTPPPANN